MLQDLFPRDHRKYAGSRFGAELEARSPSGWRGRATGDTHFAGHLVLVQRTDPMSLLRCRYHHPPCRGARGTLRLLRRYLQVGRADSDLPQLFLRIRSPIRAINRDGVIEIFNYRAARSGLPLDSSTSYSLRHAFAMRLLRRGVGIKVIGDLLGHRSLEATCVYLRVDIDMLRTVGLPVPGITSVAGGDHA